VAVLEAGVLERVRSVLAHPWLLDDARTAAAGNVTRDTDRDDLLELLGQALVDIADAVRDVP
jgi:hypothetical protein